MKKIITSLLALSMVLALTACGGGNSGGNSGGGTAGGGAASSQEQSGGDGEVYTMTICHDEVLDSPQHQAMLALEEHLESESDGRLQVEIYANGELGSADKLLEMIKMNTLQGSGFSSDYLSVYDNRLSFMQLPFLFDDFDQVNELVFNPDGELHKIYNDIAMENGSSMTAPATSPTTSERS